MSRRRRAGLLTAAGLAAAATLAACGAGDNGGTIPVPTSQGAGVTTTAPTSTSTVPGPATTAATMPGGG